MQQQMITCPNCGSQNASNQQFCVSCGAHLGNTNIRPAVSHVPIVTGVASPAVLPAMTQQPIMNQALPVMRQQVEQIDIKPTWGLAWGLLWRTIFLMLFLGGILFLGYMLARLALGYNSIFGAW
jgi:hypothetical protein